MNLAFGLLSQGETLWLPSLLACTFSLFFAIIQQDTHNKFHRSYDAAETTLSRSSDTLANPHQVAFFS